MYSKIWFLNCFFIIISSAFANDTGSNACALVEKEYGYVCMCNSTYCDDHGLMPTTLDNGSYVVFTSSKTGDRFTYKSGQMATNTTTSYSILSGITEVFDLFTLSLKIDRNVTYQEILGFGGAFTDSAGINIMNMSEAVQEYILRSYFSEEGLQYNMGRVPIGGSDFSTRGYSYQDYPSDDLTLSNFSLTYEDFDYKIPIIKRAQNLSSDELLLISAVWSPPAWMKTNNKFTGSGYLKSDHYDTYALYYIKFLEQYKENGLDIWAVSSGNEPMTGVINVLGISSLAWIPTHQAKWIVENFGPMIRDSAEFNDTKLFLIDDQRPNIDTWLPLMELAQSTLDDYMDGIAVHWYLDLVLTDFELSNLRKKYPNKFIINTEACEGSVPLLTKVELGSWSRGESYLKYLISDLNNGVNAWIDWNLVLNLSGGPNWSGNNVDAFIIADPDTDEFYKQPMYYAFGHMSKFVPRNSFRILAETSVLDAVPHIAFLRPDGYVTVIVLNNEISSKTLEIRDGDLNLELTLDPHTITTLVYNPNV